ncbi:hypothetical protein HYT18_03555 [Candidatus Microgenomates bacterium]|nr:hypothetical protein [Candidatus Microgenomates bacterium]
MQTIPWQKIKALEDEIKVLKNLGKKQVKKTTKKDSLKGILKAKPSSIEGILKGVNVSWKDFQEVKQMWLDEDHILHQKHKK